MDAEKKSFFVPKTIPDGSTLVRGQSLIRWQHSDLAMCYCLLSVRQCSYHCFIKEFGIAIEVRASKNITSLLVSYWFEDNFLCVHERIHWSTHSKAENVFICTPR